MFVFIRIRRDTFTYSSGDHVNTIEQNANHTRFESPVVTSGLYRAPDERSFLDRVGPNPRSVRLSSENGPKVIGDRTHSTFVKSLLVT